MTSIRSDNISQNESAIYSGMADEEIDYYTLYYDGDLENLNSVWSREPHFVPLIILYTSCFLCGVTGNGIVLFAIIGSKKTRNVTFTFMLSLAVADLLFLLVCVPIDTLGMVLGNWAGGVVFCKLSGFAEMLSAVSSILNLSTISVERYCVIVRPLQSRKNCTIGKTRWALLAVWVAATVLATPAAMVRNISVTTFYNNVTQVQTSVCGEHADNELLLVFAIYQCVVMFVLPSVVMAYCYSVVIYALWISRKTLSSLSQKYTRPLIKDSVARSNERSNLYGGDNNGCRSQADTALDTALNSSTRTKKCATKDIRFALKGRKQVVKMLVTVVVMFLLCWGPKLVLQILKRLQLAFVYYPSAFQAQIGIYCLTYIQSCLNPIIYGLMCKNFRLSLKYAWKTCPRPSCLASEKPETITLELYSSDTYCRNRNNVTSFSNHYTGPDR